MAQKSIFQERLNTYIEELKGLYLGQPETVPETT